MSTRNNSKKRNKKLKKRCQKMEIKYDKPTREIILPNGEFDGYETEEIVFDIDDEYVIKTIFDEYYSDYDYETFKMMYYEFDIDISDFIDDDKIKEELYEIYLQKYL